MKKASIWSAFVVLLCLVPEPARAPETDAQPETVAFVVGLEAYQNADLNKLIYVVKDARDVFEQIKAVTNFKKSRSWLLLADREAGEQEERNSETRLIRRRHWPAQQVRNELKKFLRGVKDSDNVVIYLGGHGTATQMTGLLLTASDYDPVQKLNDIPYTELIGDIDRELKELNRAKVNVALFLNVCGAGNASTMSVAPDMADAARKLESIGIGKYDFALFPATAPNEDAFEDREKRQRSVFAHSLIEGLRGGAADKTGAITAYALFEYIEKGLNKYRKEKGQPEIELPRNDSKFAKAMPIGIIKAQQGEAHYLVGTSLLAAARAIEPASSAVTNTESRERTAQSELLIDLAIDQFGQAIQRNPELKLRGRLRRAQGRLWRGMSLTSEEVQKDVLAFGTEALDTLSEAEKLDVKSFESPPPNSSKIQTLREFRDHLASGSPFHYLLITEEDKLTQMDSWAKFLAAFPGQHLISTASMDINRTKDAEHSHLPTEVIKHLSDRAAQVSNNERLIVIYDGRSSTPDALLQLRSTYPAMIGGGKEKRLYPIGRPEVEEIAKLWKGPITVVLNTPFGGTLLEDAPIGEADISLLLAAREPNGMTFSRQRDDVYEPSDLLNAWSQGAEDPALFPQAVEAREKRQELARRFGPSAGWVIGTPAWVPDWGAAGKVARIREERRQQLAPLDRWGVVVAQGCGLESFDSCETAVSARIGPDNKDTLVELANAAGIDLAGKGAEVSGTYQRVANDMDRLAQNLPNPPLGQPAAQEAIKRTADIVRTRTTGAASKAGRRIHVLLFGVERYTSPLIPDLPGTFADLKAYGEALKSTLGALSSTEVIVAPPQAARTSQDILDALALRRSDNRSQDLVILVFSGRGFEKAGRRYLATEMAGDDDRFESARYQLRLQPLEWMSKVEPQEFLDLWAIAEAMRGYWFVGLYDAQFTPPVHREGFDQILDKHIDSVRPLGPNSESLSSIVESAAPRPSSAGLPRGEVPARQVHIWLEGRLTAHFAHSTLPCVNATFTRKILPEVASPLAMAVISGITKSHAGTYRTQMEDIAKEDCIEDIETKPTLVFQGDLDVPAFASGDGAEYVQFLASDDARRDLNLRAAVGIAAAAAERLPNPRHRLARAALLVTLAQLYKDKDELLNVGSEKQGWFDEARILLEGLSEGELQGEDASDLWAARVELLVRLHELRGDPPEALRTLRDVKPIKVLAQRNLARRLVDLTDKGRSQQATDVLRRTASRLSELKKDDAAVATAAEAALEVFQQQERKRQNEPFRLRPPDTAAQPAE